MTDPRMVRLALRGVFWCAVFASIEAARSATLQRFVPDRLVPGAAPPDRARSGGGAMNAPELGHVYCAACGTPGQLPVVGQERDADLAAKPFNGVLALVCRSCREIHALDRAARGATTMKIRNTVPPGRLIYDSTQIGTEPDDDDLLTDWERDFLASVECQDYDLTEAQQAKLDEIEEAIEERRLLWRDGWRLWR